MSSDPTIRISFTGDIALNGGYEDLVRQGSAPRLTQALHPLLNGSDLVIGNLEGPLTRLACAGPPWRFSLHGNPAYAQILKAAGFNAVSLANNHAMDHGWEGLLETIGHLDSVGLRHVGAGANLQEARRPLHITVRGVKVAVLGFCDVATLSALYATDTSPGVAPLRRNLVLEDIAWVRPLCDVLILCVHWGQENISAPQPKYRQLGRDMIAAGASVVVGHHPHVLQGIERVNRGAIAYSLGNFTFSDEDWHGANREGEPFFMPYRLSEANRRSAIWKILVDSRGSVIQDELIPAYLGRDLLPVVDARPERRKQLRDNNAALKMPLYGFAWSLRMIVSRLQVNLQQVRGDQGLARKLLRLRPRHIVDLFKLLAREWEQFRGME